MVKALKGDGASLNALYLFEGKAKDSTSNESHGKKITGTPRYINVAGELALESTTAVSSKKLLPITWRTDKGQILTSPWSYIQTI